MEYLKELRGQIDSIDKEIIQLFEKRMEVVLNVAMYKMENNIPILDISREDEVINKNTIHLKNRELEDYLKEFYINLMNLSKNYQNYYMNKKK